MYITCDLCIKFSNLDGITRVIYRKYRCFNNVNNVYFNVVLIEMMTTRMQKHTIIDVITFVYVFKFVRLYFQRN